MNISQVYAVYFSATGNTRKVTTTLANALAVSFDVPLEVRDFTLPAAREEAYEFAAGDLVVFGMPTYAGKLPNKLLEFVKSGFHGNGALAVPVVTFGNRSFDNSLAELCACLEGTASTPSARAPLPAATPLPTRLPTADPIPTIWRSLPSSALRSWAASCG